METTFYILEKETKKCVYELEAHNNYMALQRFLKQNKIKGEIKNDTSDRRYKKAYLVIVENKIYIARTEEGNLRERRNKNFEDDYYNNDYDWFDSDAEFEHWCESTF